MGENEGWKWVNYNQTGRVCDFAPKVLSDKRMAPSDKVALVNTTGSAIATNYPLNCKVGKQAHEGGCQYASFDASLNQRGEAGYMQEFRGQIKLELTKTYTFAIRSNAGSSIWLEGGDNPIVEWKGCHSIGGADAFDEHESAQINGDGRWHKIILYYAMYEKPNHLFLRVKEDGIELNVNQMGVRHNNGDLS